MKLNAISAEAGDADCYYLSYEVHVDGHYMIFRFHDIATNAVTKEVIISSTVDTLTHIAQRLQDAGANMALLPCSAYGREDDQGHMMYRTVMFQLVSLAREVAATGAAI